MTVGYKPLKRTPWLSRRPLRSILEKRSKHTPEYRQEQPAEVNDTYLRSRLSDRCNLLYENFIASAVAHSLIATLMVWSQSPRVPTGVLVGWSCMIAASVAIRAVVWISYSRQSAQVDHQYWINLYLGAAILGSASWTIGGVYVAFTGDMIAIGMAVAVMAGIGAAAVALLGSVFAGCATFLVVLTVPFATALILTGVHEHTLVGILMFAFLICALSASKRYERTLLMAFQSRYDALTHLRNRQGFEAVLHGRVITNSKPDDPHVLAYIDLDRFKIINDTAGHLAGDDLLCNIARKIEAIVGDEGYVCRIGGDEFAIVFPHCVTDRARDLLSAAKDSVSTYRHNANGRLFRVTASIGMTEFSSESNLDDVLAAADIASYVAKKHGGNRIHVNTGSESDTGKYRSQFDRITDIETAMDENRLLLVGQIIQPVTPTDHAPMYCSLEILIRMVTRSGTILPASQFIPAAEHFGLMPTVDRWVVSEAVRVLNANEERLGNLGCCYINLSTQSLGDADFATFLEQQLSKLVLPSSKICFELTEGESIRDMDAATDFIKRFNRHGSRFALDDFGKGFSSLQYLQTLPVDVVKIDKSYITTAPTDPSSAAIVLAIKELSHSMNKTTIAEGVEQESHRAFLSKIGVDYMQGHAIHQPQRLDEVIEIIAGERTGLLETSHHSNTPSITH